MSYEGDDLMIPLSLVDSSMIYFQMNFQLDYVIKTEEKQGKLVACIIRRPKYCQLACTTDTNAVTWIATIYEVFTMF